MGSTPDVTRIDKESVEPPLLVFVSSVIADLALEREALNHAILGLGITRPWVFEFTPATSQILDQSYLEKVQQCDFFVLIIDRRISPAVEKEFITALKHSRPILAFLKKLDGSERDSDTESFIGQIPTKWTTYRDINDLTLKVRAAIADEIVRRVRSTILTVPLHELHQLERTRTLLHQALVNLPTRRFTHLVGREPELKAISRVLSEPENQSLPIISITGLGGIGKTALAYEVAERALVNNLFDGLVWETAKVVELEGNRTIQLPRGTILSWETLLTSIARQLGLETLLKLNTKELHSRLQQILRNGSYLIIVDNLETVSAYEELTRNLYELISPSRVERPSRALFTSRERMAQSHYIYDYYIHGLTQESSIEFIEQEAVERRAAGMLDISATLVNQIYEVTNGMPLAMKLIVSQFIVGIPLDTELDRLKNAKEEKLYEYLYMRLWFSLSSPAQKLMIAAAAFASSATRFMLQAVSNLSDDDFVSAIPELVRMSLIEASEHPTAEQRRYSIHPITRWFVNAPLRQLWERQKPTTPL